VRSLNFLLFTTGSPSSSPDPIPSASPLPHAAAAVWPCASSLPSLCRSEPCHVPSRPLPHRFPPPHWPLLARPRRPLPTRAPPRLPRAPPWCQHLLEHRHRFFWTPDAFSSFSSTRPSVCTLLLPSSFPAPITSRCPMTAAIPAHHRQLQLPLPIPDSKHHQHRHDPPQLTKRTNPSFFHQNSPTAVPASSLLPCATEIRPCSSSEFTATTPPRPNSSRTLLPHLLP
jgi:hypothetical protein